MDSLEEQFSKIYDEYIQKIYRFVYLKVNSQDTAEDITSKVFTKAWQAFKAQNPNSEIRNISSFIYKIASNSVVDYYRQKGRAITVSATDLPEMADKAENAQNKAILSADLEVVKRALLKVKKEHQDVIIWHYLDDMPIAQMADILGKKEGTVRVMLHRGLKELQSVIKGGSCAS